MWYLIIALYGSGSAIEVMPKTFTTQMGCETAGKKWMKGAGISSRKEFQCLYMSKAREAE